jgi:hypothetical protein
MNVSPANHTPPAAAAIAAAAAAAIAHPVVRRISAAEVSATALKHATGDGDGRMGAAALNDGDAASIAAKSTARGSVDVHA